MLILSRKKEERIYIGDEIIITVLSSNSSGVRLGFDAPQEIPVHREEIYAAIHGQQNRDQLSDINVA